MSGHLDIIRHSKLGDGTFSDVLWNGEYLFKLCERTSTLIPPGEYQLLPHTSQKPCLARWEGRTVAFHNPALNVYAEPAMIPPGVQGARFCCLIHPADWPFQLEGCGAPGHEILQLPPHGWGVDDSRDAFGLIVPLWGDRTGLTATIKESFQ